MNSTFHFSGPKILDQTIARDVNALNAQLRQIDQVVQEELRELRLVNVEKALKLFEDENNTLDD